MGTALETLPNDQVEFLGNARSVVVDFHYDLVTRASTTHFDDAVAVTESIGEVVDQCLGQPAAVTGDGETRLDMGGDPSGCGLSAENLGGRAHETGHIDLLMVERDGP